MPTPLLAIAVLLVCGLLASLLAGPFRQGKLDVSRGSTCLLLLIGLGVICYVNCFGNDFVWDDTTLIVTNESIRNWYQWPRAFLTDLYDSPVSQSFYYRPLQHLSYRLDFSLWGLRPAGYHVGNVLFHIGNAILIYLLVSRFSKQTALGLVCGCLYLVHPIHTQAVTYIAGRADPMCTFFLLVTFWFYANARESGGHRFIVWLCLALLAYVAALCSKEFAVVFPALLLAFELTLPKPDDKPFAGAAIARLLPFVLLVVAVFLVRKAIFGMANPSDPIADTGVSRGTLCLRALGAYCGLLVAPLDLHMERTVVFAGWKGAQLTFFGFACAAAMVGAIILYWRRNRAVAFALLWFAIFFLPVSNLWPLHSTLAEHWMYFASIGWLWSVCAIFHDCLCTWKRTATNAARIAVPVVIFFVLGFCARTIYRNFDWRDEITFYRQTILAGGGSPRVHNNLGMALSVTHNDIEEAVREYQKALELDPNFDPALVNLGLLHAGENRYDQAVPLFQRAIRAKPWRVEAYVNLADAFGKADKTNEALEVFGDAVERFPQSSLVAFRYGLFAFRQGNLGLAEKEFVRGQQIAPHSAEFVNALGVLALQQGKPEEAIRLFERAKQLDRLDLNPYVNLAHLYQKQERFADADRELSAAQRLDPNNPEFPYRLGILHWRLGHVDEAKRLLGRAVWLYADFASAKEALQKVEAGLPMSSTTTDTRMDANSVLDRN